MAKITITFEDAPEGKVRVQSTPTFETMAQMDLSGEHLTAAMGYAIHALNAIRKAAKDQAQSQLNIYIPKIGR